ncbi:hypothetical protein C2G38_2239777 [Gigaspora rosea]|uniref:Uncharacterized protein n=1 Tax=Gigaspora rosea TaxID=44941 RepID=A0A397VZM8_9GLOM|nr:hypothetical protein C2G38_2239777 [Gigaspora rosea]
MSSQVISLLSFHLNACPICVSYLVCVKTYGNGCSCPPMDLHWKCKRGSDHKLDFFSKHITRAGANKKKVKYDQKFVDWLKRNVTLVEITKNQDFINICRKSKGNSTEVVETIDLTHKELLEPLGCSSTMNFLELDLHEVTSNKVTKLEVIKEPMITFVTLVCYDRFEKAHKKLDRALAIPYNLDNIKNIEEEIYLIHFLNNEGIVAFVAEIKNKKIFNYAFTKIKNNESNKANKKICNLPSCDTHIQRCLISEDGRHLKLDDDLVTLCARAIYRCPISKRLSNTLLNEANTIDITSTSIADSYLSTIDSTSTIVSSTIMTKLYFTRKYQNTSTTSQITILFEGFVCYSSCHLIAEVCVMVYRKKTPKNQIGGYAIHKKKTPFKYNIYVTKNMTFNDLLVYIFPNGPPNKK